MPSLRKMFVITALGGAVAYGWDSYSDWYQDYARTAITDSENARAAMRELLPYAISLRTQFEQPGHPNRLLWQETNAAIEKAQDILHRTHYDIVYECRTLWDLQGINMTTGTQFTLSPAAEAAYKKCAAHVFEFR